jgi:transposase
MDEKLKDQKTLKPKIKGTLQELKEESFNSTDPEYTRIKKEKNFYVGFNFQSTVDNKQGLILSVDVVNEANDVNQFASQINKANHILGKKCKTAVADSGYASTDQLEKIDKQEIKVIVPSKRQVSKKELSLFAKERFTYRDDYYLCPQGHKLTPYRLNKNKNKVYKITDKKICLICPHYGICTTSPPEEP